MIIIHKKVIITETNKKIVFDLVDIPPGDYNVQLIITDKNDKIENDENIDVTISG